MEGHTLLFRSDGPFGTFLALFHFALLQVPLRNPALSIRGRSSYCLRPEEALHQNCRDGIVRLTKDWMRFRQFMTLPEPGLTRDLTN